MTDIERLCQTPETPGCEQIAVTAFFCQAEGREVRLCGPCRAAWQAYARNDARVAVRCPKCAPRYLADLQEAEQRRQFLATPPAPQRSLPPELAAAVDRAMFLEGILIDKRQAVLNRLQDSMPELEVAVGV